MNSLWKGVHIKLPGEVWILGTIGLVHALVGGLSVYVHFGFFGWIFVGTGLVTLGAACKMFTTWLIRRLCVRKFIFNGCYVDALITECKVNEAVTHHGENPYQLIAKRLDETGTLRTYTSEDIDSINAPDLVGSTVKVYTDGKSKFYYMDIGLY